MEKFKVEISRQGKREKKGRNCSMFVFSTTFDFQRSTSGKLVFDLSDSSIFRQHRNTLNAVQQSLGNIFRTFSLRESEFDNSQAR